MNHAVSNQLTKISTIHKRNIFVCQQAIIVEQLANEQWQLDNGLLAIRAFSCLVKPQPGDEVLYVNSANEQQQILSILTRQNAPGTVTNACNNISLPANQSFQLQAENVDLLSHNKISLLSAKDIELNAATGNLTLTARHLFQTIQQSLIQICKQIISRAEQVDMTASQLMRTQARHQIITADKEMRIDAERINMG